MKNFFKFAIYGLFFKGGRKFITMAVAVYLLLNINGEIEDNNFADFESDEKGRVALSATVNDSLRSPASSDALNLKSLNGTKAEFVKKEKEFKSFGGNSNGIASAVSETISENNIKNNNKKENKSSRNTGLISSTSPSNNSADTTTSDTNSNSSSISSSSTFFGNSLPNLEDPTDDNDSSSEVIPRSDSSVERTISCSSDRSEGLFSSNISLILSCSESAAVEYCVQQGGGCCDPFSNPTTFTGSLELNSGDGDYCVSFFGTSSDGVISEVTSLNYQIDSTTPDLVVDFSLIQVQSTELPFINETQSSDFGKANHFYHQINLGSHDPGTSGLNLTCSEIFNTYSSITSPTPIAIETNLDTSGNTPADQINQTVDSGSVYVGANYIVTILEDRTRNVFSCQTQKVVLEDIVKSGFTATGKTPVVSGVRKTAGQFVGFGHFQLPAAPTSSGKNENEQSGTVNKTDLLNVFY